ncbi:cytochrome P450-4 [Coleophoma cylindrospora]|uniref:Cytochrome P450-4 n=1 Tax=Coleophoma cylindrospora TaxID=1849047 RepID=A0A3D8SE90_9HELO|nr:cytochrome P450-4 [Coleophoma cylindrospora]
MPLICENIELMSRRLSESQESNRPLCLTDAFPALTGDIIMEYSFGFCYKSLEDQKFASFHEAFNAIGAAGHIGAQFPGFFWLMNQIPDSITEKLQPALASLLRMKRDQWDLVAKTIREHDAGTQSGRRTIFSEIMQSNLPPEDKTQQRLADEAQTVVGAGVETTSFALCVGSFHIAGTPRIYERLHTELVAACPDWTALPDLHELEKLPYLKACILESLRLSYGLSARNPRTHDRPIQYKEWTIPAETVIAMTIVDVHHDEKIFPDSHAFVPERWLNDPKTADGTPLEHYLMAFGRGPRACLGINMAWTELYLAVGTIFRRFRFELFETDISDVTLEHDNFIPNVKLDSKGVRVLVCSVVDC